MPSSLVHLAVAGLLAAALLGEAYDKRSLLVVLGVAVFPDLDSFIALVSSVGHRAVLHTVWIPLGAAALLYVDIRVREASLVERRWGSWGVRVAWVAILVYLCGHVLLDLTDGVANLLWPVHDQFYTLRGSAELSDQRGLVQTFFRTDGAIPVPESVGTTDEVEITTGVDPGPDQEERVFPLFGAGWELVVFLIGVGVTAVKFKLPFELPREQD